MISDDWLTLHVRLKKTSENFTAEAWIDDDIEWSIFSDEDFTLNVHMPVPEVNAEYYKETKREEDADNGDDNIHVKD